MATSKLARPSSSAIRISSTGPPPSPPSSSAKGSENQPRSAMPLNSSGGTADSSSHSLALSAGQTSATNWRAVARSISCSSVRPKSTACPLEGLRYIVNLLSYVSDQTPSFPADWPGPLGGTDEGRRQARGAAGRRGDRGGQAAREGRL